MEDNFSLKMKQFELEALKHAEEAEGRDGLILQLNNDLQASGQGILDLQGRYESLEDKVEAKMQ